MGMCLAAWGSGRGLWLFLLPIVILSVALIEPPSTMASAAEAARPKNQGPATGAPLLGAPAGKTPPSSKGLMRISGEYVEFSHGQRMVIIKGAAYIEHEDLKFWAENIQGDMQHHQIYAQGKVVFWQGDEKMSGEFLSYNYKTKKGRITKLLTRRGPNFIRARELLIEPFKMVGRHVSTSACDHDPPHYEIAADEMVMYPRDRMILSRARLRVNGHTWLRFPQYVVNLKDPQRVDRLYISPGFTSSKGFYAKMSYSYYFGRSAYGKVWARPSQNAGGESGITLQFQPSERIKGSLNASRFSSSKIDQKEDRISLSTDGQLSKTARIHVDGTYTGTQFSGQAENQELRVNALLSERVGNWDAELAVQRRIDLDKDAYTGDDGISSLNTSPRLGFRQRQARELGKTGVKVRWESSVARITEDGASGQVSATRSEVKADVSPPAVKLPLLGPVAWNVRESHVRFGGLGDRQTLNLNANATVRHSEDLSTAFSYVFQNVRGDSPFPTYDKLSDSNVLTGYLRMQHGTRFNATLMQTTYDLLTGRFIAASSNFTLRNHPGAPRDWSLGISPIYSLGPEADDWGAFKVTNVSGNFRVAHPKLDWRHSLIANYDTAQRRLGSAAITSDFYLGETVRFMTSANASFDPIAQNMELTRLAVGLVKDMHAWEGRLRWDVRQKEAWIEFYLKSASQKRLTLGVDYEAGLALDPSTSNRIRGPVFPQ